MVFGPLADTSVMSNTFGADHAFLFVVSVSAIVIVVSSLSSFFYHYGILQRAVHLMAVLMQKTMRTSGSESLAAAVNIFVGQTESALVIKLYLAGMTASEILALMTVGMATIASGIMVVYAGMGLNAGHLLTASVMSAPGALLIAKIMLPETDPSETASTSRLKTEVHTINGLDALCRGAAEGATLAINIMAMLIAFVAALAMANFTLGWLQRQCGVQHPISLQTMLGWLNAPFAWLMGAAWKDCARFGQLLGERILLNEFIAYRHLADLARAEANPLLPRTVTLATYALCGFANFASIAVQIGGISSLAPGQRGNLARFGVRAMVGGLLTCYLSATIAGLLMD